MAYPISPQSVIEVIFPAQLFGQVCMNVMHYRYTGTTVISNGAAAIGGLLDAMDITGGLLDKWCQCFVTDLTIPAITGQMIYPARFVKVQHNNSEGNSHGGNTGTSTNPSMAVCITRRGEVTGRHARGTLHFAGFPNEQTIGGVLADAASVVLGPLAGALITDVIGGGVNHFSPVVYNRAAPSNSTIIFSATVETTLRTMRRRVVGRGI